MTGKRKRRRDEMKDESSSAIEMMCYVQQSQREKVRGKERRNEGRKEGRKEHGEWMTRKERSKM